MNSRTVPGWSWVPEDLHQFALLVLKLLVPECGPAHAFNDFCGEWMLKNFACCKQEILDKTLHAIDEEKELSFLHQ